MSLQVKNCKTLLHSCELLYVTVGRPRRNAESITFGHHYQVDVFFNIVDTQLTELNDRFPEESSLLLKRIAYINPDHLLTQDNVGELVALARMYPMDFSAYDLVLLKQQLRNFRSDLKSNKSLREVRSLSGLAVRLIELNKSVTYHLVFRLITLVLTLPVSTASTERTFSALKNVKTRLRNKIGDGFLADALVLYVEKDVAKSVSNEAIIERFAAMGNRRLQLK